MDRQTMTAPAVKFPICPPDGPIVYGGGWTPRHEAVEAEQGRSVMVWTADGADLVSIQVWNADGTRSWSAEMGLDAATMLSADLAGALASIIRR